MIKNYCRIVWRNLKRNRLYSVINIAGLAIGIAVSFLLLIYVHHEYSYDKFNVKNDRVYLIFKNLPANGQIRTNQWSPIVLAPALKKDYPEIEDVARANVPENSLISYQEKRLKISTMAADPALLDLFSFDFFYGNKRLALSGQHTIVLTWSVARALFGNVDPVGRTVRINGEFPLTVSGVIADNRSNSSLSFEALISWGTLIAQRPWLNDAGWDVFSYSTYVLLRPGAGIAGINSKIRDIVGQHDAANKGIKLFLYPLAKLHLYNEFQNGYNAGGRIETVRLFFLLALGILLIACINFMNLSTARSGKRAREVGVRKAMGALRSSLVMQFMTEGILMALISFLLALILLTLALPSFSRLIHIQLALPYQNGWAWSLALGITIVTGLMAGSYPAWFLSSFNPVRVLKGQLVSAKAAVHPRQLLVITQFTFAICLIISSIFIYRQINFIKDRPVGYERNSLVEMPVEGRMFTAFESFRREAIESGAVSDAAMTSASITSNNSSVWDVVWPNQLPGENRLPIDCMAVTWHFISTYGLQLSEGRDFDPGRPADSAAVVLNQAAVSLMRLTQPVGQEIRWMGAKRTVIGVVRNFVWGSPFEPVKPAIIGFMKDWVGNIGLKLNPRHSASASLAALQAVYRKYNPDYPMVYSFADETFSKKYSDEQLLGSISIGFTSLAIFISCLGLFGLASFSAEQRKKEISIRKVLGAGTGNLWMHLSWNFVSLVLIAFVIGSAISWYTMHQWLAKYAYHTPFSGWVFVATLCGSIFICLAAVSWQAIRSASANPVDSLRQSV